MNGFFADTFYWIAVTNVRDRFHAKAIAFSVSVTIFTTEEVLTEYLNYFAGWGPGFRSKALINVKNMINNPMVRIVPQTAASFLSGLQLYGIRLDKGYSLTDCISMQTLRSLGINDVLTNDAHFEQEGFYALFREF